MASNYPYLNDSTFLTYFDRNRLKEEFARVTVLTLEEKPIKAIEGRVISGTINYDGTSSVRRTASLTLVANGYTKNDLTNVRNLISLNKKVKLEVGFLNNTTYYTDYPVIWFPLGIYVMISPSISFGSDGLKLTLQLRDKMCLLNGECGGTLPASVTFSEYDTVDENGAFVTLYPTLYQIIQEAVNHFGGEQLSKIIISDVDLRIKKVMKWTGSSPLYIIWRWSGDAGDYQMYATTNTSDVNEVGQEAVIATYSYGDDVGYIYSDFIYSAGDLIGDAGNSVCDVLDKIKSYLGNYEYFYDVDGNFIFQEIKNYLNTTQAKVELDKMENSDYLVDMSKGKAVYVFDDSNLVTAYSNSPQWNMIKNDFIVWGTRENADGISVACRYHLCVDEKPRIGENTYQVFFYADPDDGLTKAKCPIMFESKDLFPYQGVEEVFYMDTSTDIIYKWNPNYNSEDDKYEAVAVGLLDITPTDWRSELYLAGACAEPFGKDSNYYYTELNAEWPKLYHFISSDSDGNIRVDQGFYEEVLKYPCDVDYFLDFIDSGAAISEFNISNIGRRTKVIVDKDVNCVFEPEIPDFVLLETGTDDLPRLRQECQAQNQPYIQVDSGVYALLAPGGSHNSAYEYVRELLYQYTSYNETISITCVPIFHLEPNTRITVRNNQSGIYGDYMINSISIPLDTAGTMTISATRALERI